MSERRTDEISRELRATAPTAPPELRERVGGITAQADELAPRVAPRRLLALAAAAALVLLTLGAAVVPRLEGDETGDRTALEPAASRERAQRGVFRDNMKSSPDTQTLRRGPADASAAATTLPPGRRFQDYRVAITLRVGNADALSAKAQQAMRGARALGGFVASVDFATAADDGTASLVLRVPVTRIQDAIASFSELGTIVAQDVQIRDLQPQVDRLAATIARVRARIAELEAKERRTPAEEAQLLTLRGQLHTATRTRQRLTNEASYATVRLDLTTRKAAENRDPGAFRTFWNDASKILLTELIWLLYALVVAGPFLLLALLAVLAERARRRRSDNALLAHH